MAIVRKVQELNKDILIKADTMFWIEEEKVVNEDEQRIDFHKFFFLKALYMDRSKKIVVKKSGQAGGLS